jgi:hypothetical protein
MASRIVTSAFRSPKPQCNYRQRQQHYGHALQDDQRLTGKPEQATVVQFDEIDEHSITAAHFVFAAYKQYLATSRVNDNFAVTARRHSRCGRAEPDCEHLRIGVWHSQCSMMYSPAIRPSQRCALMSARFMAGLPFDCRATKTRRCASEFTAQCDAEGSRSGQPRALITRAA